MNLWYTYSKKDSKEEEPFMSAPSKERVKETNKNSNSKKRITTVPQFEATKKLMKENKKIINLVSKK